MRIYLLVLLVGLCLAQDVEEFNNNNNNNDNNRQFVEVEVIAIPNPLSFPTLRRMMMERMHEMEREAEEAAQRVEAEMDREMQVQQREERSGAVYGLRPLALRPLQKPAVSGLRPLALRPLQRPVATVSGLRPFALRPLVKPLTTAATTTTTRTTATVKPAVSGLRPFALRPLVKPAVSGLRPLAFRPLVKPTATGGMTMTTTPANGLTTVRSVDITPTLVRQVMSEVYEYEVCVPVAHVPVDEQFTLSFTPLLSRSVSSVVVMVYSQSLQQTLLSVPSSSPTLTIQQQLSTASLRSHGFVSFRFYVSAHCSSVHLVLTSPHGFSTQSPSVCPAVSGGMQIGSLNALLAVRRAVLIGAAVVGGVILLLLLISIVSCCRRRRCRRNNNCNNNNNNNNTTTTSTSTDDVTVTATPHTVNRCDYIPLAVRQQEHVFSVAPPPPPPQQLQQQQQYYAVPTPIYSVPAQYAIPSSTPTMYPKF